MPEVRGRMIERGQRHARLALSEGMLKMRKRPASAKHVMKEHTPTTRVLPGVKIAPLAKDKVALGARGATLVTQASTQKFRVRSLACFAQLDFNNPRATPSHAFLACQVIDPSPWAVLTVMRAQKDVLHLNLAPTRRVCRVQQDTILRQCLASQWRCALPVRLDFTKEVKGKQNVTSAAERHSPLSKDKKNARGVPWVGPQAAAVVCLVVKCVPQESTDQQKRARAPTWMNGARIVWLVSFEQRRT